MTGLSCTQLLSAVALSLSSLVPSLLLSIASDNRFGNQSIARLRLARGRDSARLPTQGSKQRLLDKGMAMCTYVWLVLNRSPNPFLATIVEEMKWFVALSRHGVVCPLSHLVITG